MVKIKQVREWSVNRKRYQISNLNLSSMHTAFYIANRIDCPIDFLRKLLLCESRSLTEGFYFPSKSTF